MIKRSLYWKFTVAMWFLVLIPTAGLTAYHYLYQRTSIAHREIQKAATIAASLRSEIDSYLSGSLRLPRSLALPPQHAAAVQEILARGIKDAELTVYLVNRMGVILASHGTGADAGFRSLSPLAPQDAKLLMASRQFADEEIRPLALNELKDAHECVLKSGEAGTCQYRSDGKQRVAALAPLKSQRWSVVVSKPLDAIYSDAKTVLLATLAVAAALLGTTALPGYLITTNITRPLYKLLDAMDRFGQGDLGVRCPVEAKDELGELAAAFNRMAATIDGHTADLEQKVQERTRDLETACQQIGKLSQTDALTGTFNRRYLEEVLEKETRRAKLAGTFLSIAMCDIDHFKRINDTYGHSAGDLVLAGFAGILQEATRKETDVVCRFGGEEFVIVFAHTSAERAHAMAERIREAVERRPFAWEGQEIRVTASFGVAGIPAPGGGYSDAKSLILKADQLLYLAKDGGRNQTRAEGAIKTADA